MESLEAKDRSRNLIFTGLSEESNEIGDNDYGKIKYILNKLKLTSISTDEFILKRLGTVYPESHEKYNADYKRPLKVQVPTTDIRKQILENKDELKKITELKKIYVKKDTHPTIRKELKRIYDKEKEEKDKPENAGVEINYDHKRRVLYRGGQVIDRFNPNYFL